jgi:two-component system cell cycle response regulator DivK
MSQRILVIEDQADNRRILRDLLTNADFEVIEAEDGEAGLAAATSHRPDLVLMDIQLPGIDGYEVTRRLKADTLLQAIPVIAVTSYALAGEADTARARGCCPRTASGHAAAVPPRSVMNSRRRMSTP